MVIIICADVCNLRQTLTYCHSPVLLFSEAEPQTDDPQGVLERDGVFWCLPPHDLVSHGGKIFVHSVLVPPDNKLMG